MDSRKQFQFRDQKVPFQVSLLARGAEYDVELVEIAFDQCLLVVPKTKNIYIPLGQELRLKFSGEKLRRTTTVSAILNARSEIADKRRFGFLFVNPIQVENDILPVLRSHFNRRSTFRVEPSAAAPIALAIAHSERAVQAKSQVADISGGGLATEVPLDVEILFADTEKIRLSFQLPNHPEVLQLEAWIRHRELRGNMVRFGIEFDARRSKNFNQSQKWITEYTMLREGEALKEPKTS